MAETKQMQLSKSDYMLFLKHPAWLWLKKHDPNKLPPVDAGLQAIFDTGHDFEQYAEALFKGGETLGFNDYDQYTTLPAKTIGALASGAQTIFQGRFEYNNITFICDIVQVVGKNLLDLYEIKSSTNVKPEHIDDLTFQTVVLKKCGITVRNIYVICVNNQYVRKGSIKPAEITNVNDVTAEVKAKYNYAVGKIDEALAAMTQKECPEMSPLNANPKYFKDWLEVYTYINKPDPGSIFDLCQMDANTYKNLLDSNIKQINEIPTDFALKSKQNMQVQALKNGKPIIDKAKITDFLATFKYPLYFFDYETLGGLEPRFDGMRPYAQYPFQYSLHVLKSPDAKLEHYEYLHTKNSNPAKDVVKAMKLHFDKTGSIITWNMSFEKSCNDTLAQFVPTEAQFLKDINARIVDLMIPFSNGWYVDSGFNGSASIKYVLPVLVPELSYKELNIQEGGSAQRVWMETILDGKNASQKDQILANLLVYCGLDTLAMVKIYNVLNNL